MAALLFVLVLSVAGGAPWVATLCLLFQFFCPGGIVYVLGEVLCLCIPAPRSVSMSLLGAMSTSSGRICSISVSADGLRLSFYRVVGDLKAKSILPTGTKFPLI